jgi:uncharacterized coiled-coil DUF342 family protein
MTISEYVSTLTPAEREQHKDFIDECLAREVQIKKNGADSQQRLVELADENRHLHLKVRELLEQAQAVHQWRFGACLQTASPLRIVH